MPIDPVQLLCLASPGIAWWTREQIGGAWEIAWLIRERSAWVEKLGSQPEVEFRAGLFWEDGVGLLPVLVRVGPVSKRSVYETWVNEHAEGQSGTLATLAEQSRLAVHLYIHGGQFGRLLVVSNGLNDFARQALAQIATQPAWSLQAFEQARKYFYARHPEPWHLWQKLGQEDV